MLTGFPVLESTDWSRLFHAYGRATDTPEHLRALLAGEGKPRSAAIFHLWSAIIHQGMPYTETGPVALFIAGLLRDKGVAPALEQIRAELFSFLVYVAEVVAEFSDELAGLEQVAAGHDLDAFIDAGDDEAVFAEAGETFYARTLLGCAQAAPALMEVMLEGLTDADPRVRANASEGATILAGFQMPG